MSIPWIEKYRPTTFQGVILEPHNKLLFDNMLEQLYFPNLLIYGGPGTGKTTTIINLINAYQLKTLQRRNNSLVIHLNASDERGIDIIRLQINQFVSSKSLFENHHQHMKFVILDEVDYMTKSAQQALKYLLQTYTENVRFCLICNYISRIDVELQNELLKVHFNELPKSYVVGFLAQICRTESLPLDDETLMKIQSTYKSDVRSMINYLQINQDVIELNKLSIFNDSVIRDYMQTLQSISLEKWKQDRTYLQDRVDALVLLMAIYNIDAKTMINAFVHYIVRSSLFTSTVTSEFLDFAENVVHNPVDTEVTVTLKYFIYRLRAFLP